MDDPSVAPTEATRSIHDRFREQLPFEDVEDFELATRGLVEATPELSIASRLGDFPCWDLGEYGFIGERCPETVNPSLWRLARLNMNAGLFEVTERVYQVRGFDLANISFIETDSGVVVLDALTAAETAEAALALYRKHRGDRPVVAVIHSHSHVDHFAGIRGILGAEGVDAGRVRIIAPEGFLEEAASENVMAGAAMTRRASYMYGMLLPKGPLGQVDASLGKAVSAAGTTGLAEPTDLVSETGHELDLDGLRFVFQMTPGTEAPAEMNFHLPELRLLCTAENANATMHNLYTLRGAAVRDARSWSHYLHEAWELFGDRTETLLTVHHWPRWGKEAIGRFLREQADLYKFLHDQTLRLANRGFTMNEIADRIELPGSLARRWHSRGYYGSVSHNVRAVYQRYLGFFDGNPANLDPLPPEDAGGRYVEFMGGAEAVIEKARESFDAGDYRWVVEVLGHVVFSDPGNREARELSARAMRQLAYQTENATWRNFYLTGAQELETDLPAGLPTVPLLSEDAAAALDSSTFLDYMAIHLDGPAAEGRRIEIGLELPDTGESFRLELRNSVLNHFPADAERAVDSRLRLDRADLISLAMGQAEMGELIERGSAAIEGDREPVERLLALLEPADMWFNIVTP